MKNSLRTIVIGLFIVLLNGADQQPSFNIKQAFTNTLPNVGAAYFGTCALRSFQNDKRTLALTELTISASFAYLSYTLQKTPQEIKK